MRIYFMKTGRISFSKWTEADLPLASSLWGDAQVARFLCADGIFREEEIALRLAREMENDSRFGVQYWPIFSLAGCAFLGCCGLRLYRAEERIYELGFHLKSEQWGKGYALEAAGAVIAYAFDHLGAFNVFAGHHPGNSSSQRLLAKLGFHHVRDEYYAPTGLCHPSYLYRLPG